MFFTDYTTRNANGITSVVSYINRIRVIGVSFDQGKDNLVRVRGELELSELELTELK